MAPNTQEQRRLWLIDAMLAEREEYAGIDVPTDDEGQRKLLRALFNVRPPEPVSDEFLQVQDSYLQQRTREKGVTRLEDLEPVQPHIYVWRGDITTLAVDGIVNAANSQMLGCFAPNHGCIDNAIHTFAGVELRMECADMMREQGREEPTGQAKITRAYNLPAKRIIHTVGPIANGKPTDEHRAQLAQCYRSCLDCAAENKLHSIAFCCISTGVFGFPQKKAAELAVNTVRKWLNENDLDMTVVFNVFVGEDEHIYRELLGI